MQKEIEKKEEEDKMGKIEIEEKKEKERKGRNNGGDREGGMRKWMRDKRR